MMRKYRKALSFVALALLSVLAITGCSKPKEQKLVMGFVPMREAEQLVEDVKPLAEMLSKELGVKVEPFTAVNYVAVVEGLGSNQVNFGFLPPFGYLLAHSEYNAKVMLTSLGKDGKPYYQSQFLVRKDSGIKTFEDLKGKKFAFVDPASTSGYLFPGAHLKSLGLDLDRDLTTVFAGGHDKALQAVLNKDVDAAATFVDSRERYAADFPNAMAEVEILGLTDKIPNVSVTVSSKLDEQMQNKIADALLKIAADPEGKKMLIDLFNMHGFVRATHDDYKVIEDTARFMNVDLRKAQ